MGKDILELFTLDIDDKKVFVGSDLSTRELYFYVIENDSLVPISKELFNKVSDKVFDKVSDNAGFKELLESLVKTYAKDNTNKLYDNTNLNRNWKNIRILYNQSKLNKSSASYELINNILNFELPKELLSFSGILPLEVLHVLRTIIIHEIGHMSVSELLVENSCLVAKVGFWEKRYFLKEKLLTTDGNNYFRVESSKEPQINKGQGLEELFNELETDIRANSATAPRFAYELDKLTNGRLRIARQNHSLESYYSMMYEINPSENMAEILLLAINKYYELLHNQDNEMVNRISNLINNIIFEYQISKSNLPKK